ncbi:ribosome biosynthesis protein rrb1 [Serendipita sp. 401]|nr:ribosome biosynthesis protein rrb1 [Serendipita sp. 401]KAG9056433.1 ribosome biosynthesis protein rrb1 [Serendipita sp. 407]
MSASKKRTVNDLDDSHAEPNKRGPSSKRKGNEEVGMGDFEDEWEDEVDSDEGPNEGEEAGQGNQDDAMDIDIHPAVEDAQAPSSKQAAPQTFLPGLHKLSKDEILEPDQSAYEMLHRMNVAWPCLSFDVLRDGLGEERRKYPATAYVVTGTQADTSSKNEVLVMKMSALYKTQKDDGSGSDDEDSDDDDGALDEDAVLEYKSIPHVGGVNRVRAQPTPLNYTPNPSLPYHVATWADTGKVHIYNVRPFMEALDPSPQSGSSIPEAAKKPVHTITSHGRSEGFALDWAASFSADNTSVSGVRLLSGDITSKIYLTTSTVSGFTTSPNPFTSHTSSIEDLQWSPSEPTVFASCSADQSIRIWDVRVKGRKSAMVVENAHDADINVISWNRTTGGSGYLMVSGGDEGGLKVWDLRGWNKPSQKPSPVAAFTWHKAPITSVEWHPTEESAFVASGADDQITIWDLAVEEDPDEVGGTNGTSDPSLRHVPAQLLFVHQGQKDIKEVHWHSQIPGAVVSTAFDGFNIFKTISI